MPDAETEYELDKQLIEMIDLNTINKTVENLYKPMENLVVMVRQPEKEGPHGSPPSRRLSMR